jgi:hypothetical protein
MILISRCIMWMNTVNFMHQFYILKYTWSGNNFNLFVITFTNRLTKSTFKGAMYSVCFPLCIVLNKEQHHTICYHLQNGNAITCTNSEQSQPVTKIYTNRDLYLFPYVEISWIQVQAFWYISTFDFQNRLTPWKICGIRSYWTKVYP